MVGTGVNSEIAQADYGPLGSILRALQEEAATRGTTSRAPSDQQNFVFGQFLNVREISSPFDEYGENCVQRPPV